METLNGIDVAEEKLLFHGITPGIVETICAENLDIRLAGTNAGAVLGHGTYFSTAAKMSDCYASPDPKSGHRFMLLLSGSCRKVDKGTAWPKTSPKNYYVYVRRLYNSCVDNGLKPSIFCIVDHVQYYPEYVIEYE
ncbi:hypothetical protein DPMN_045339 [Dreissena polymorpha]|uniref:Poly [ADP-ribose] polymerase n=1 Tax=Dreissena polymorpha TaxID=45954 RepID=A0A9D4HZK2_DREPO|nr:hypothetical protein DPMN_045339 [Dreissena polymorpha]